MIYEMGADRPLPLLASGFRVHTYGTHMYVHCVTQHSSLCGGRLSTHLFVGAAVAGDVHVGLPIQRRLRGDV